MIRIALRVLLGLAMCVTLVYLALHSGLPDLLEGANPDGSNSITWRSEVTLACLLVLCESISFRAFRRGFALPIFLGLAACFMGSSWLFSSKFAFAWEAHNADGTFRLTWRSDLMMLALVVVCLLISFLVLWTTRKFILRGRVHIAGV